MLKSQPIGTHSRTLALHLIQWLDAIDATCETVIKAYTDAKLVTYVKLISEVFTALKGVKD